MQTATQAAELSPALPHFARTNSRERVRILHVVPQLGSGGTEHTLLRLMNGLGEEEFEQRICATRGFDAEFAARYNVSDKLVAAGESTQSFQFPLFKLRQIIRKFRPHIVHSRNWGSIEAIPAAKMSRVPVAIHSEHGYEVDSLKGMPLRRRVFRRAVYAMTDAVFANTRELSRYHARQAWTESERIRVIRNGVDTKRFSPNQAARARLRRELGFSDANFVVGSVGRLVAIKDLGTLLRAAAILVQRGVDAKALIVGQGPELRNLERQAQELPELAGRVAFFGPSDRVFEVLNALDVFVLPSLGEGMSNTVLEAMATGLPVVATLVGGNPELIGDGRDGQLFSAGDFADLARILARMWSDRGLRERLSAAARHKAVAEFSLNQMIAQYRDLYTGLLVERNVLAGQGGQRSGAFVERA
jgi:sugar transferase (PEP-CTERM/EpsH1 system associated)